MSNRILDYPEATEITSNDYILLDNEGTGAKCIKASALNINMDNYTIKEARGAIASFDDGEDLPLAFMGAYITALQDLHGYDYPWVGGSGKNKLQTTATSKTQEGVTYTVNSDGTVTVSGTATGYSSLALGKARVNSSMGNVTISGIANVTNIMWSECNVLDENEQLVVQITGGSQYPSITFDLSNYPNAYYISLAVKRNNNVATSGTIKPQVEVGSTATSFAPYSNICPISGWSAVNVTRCGKNWLPTGRGYNFPYNADVGTVLDVDTDTADWIDDENGEYEVTLSDWQRCGLLSNQLPIGETAYVRIKIVSGSPRVTTYTLDTDYKVIRKFSNYNPASDGLDYNTQIQLAENERYVGVAIVGSNKKVIISNPHIVLNTDEPYEPYNGHTYSLTFTDGTNPLKVYYGKVDLISGILTINKCGDDMGNMNYTYQSLSGGRNGFSVSISDMKETIGGSEIIDAISSCYKATNYNGTWANGNMSYFYPTGKTVIFINNDYTDASTFKTAMTGQQFVYPLATPLTYQLSKQQINSLVGVNNIFASTGDSIVDYRKLWVKPEM